MLNLTEMRRQCRTDYPAELMTSIVHTDKLEQLIDIAIASKRAMAHCDAINASELIRTDSEYERDNAKLEELRKRVRVLLENVEVDDET